MHTNQHIIKHLLKESDLHKNKMHAENPEV
jgi:hypothetical protein